MARSTRQQNRSENLNGFENDSFYKIRNVGDNNVVHLEGNILVCKPEDEDNQDCQLFRAIEQPNGAFRIMPKQQSGPNPLVWDYLPHRLMLIPRKISKTDKFTQNWTSEVVPGFNSLYLIQSGPDDSKQKCLKNNGAGNQIVLIAKENSTIHDNFTHWYLEPQEYT